MGRSGSIQWTQEMDAALGKQHDSDVAACFGISKDAVVARRRKLGVVALDHRSEITTWTPNMDALLGTDIDSRIAERLGVTFHQVFHRRRTLGIKAWRKS